MNQAKAASMGFETEVATTGAGHSYFGHDEFEKFAPGLKSLADAVEIRIKVLRAFGHGEINTSDCSFNCTRISVTRPGSGLEQMNFQHGRTK